MGTIINSPDHYLVKQLILPTRKALFFPDNRLFLTNLRGAKQLDKAQQFSVGIIPAMIIGFIALLFIAYKRDKISTIFANPNSKKEVCMKKAIRRTVDASFVRSFYDVCWVIETNIIVNSLAA